ncbi:MAG TPA: hypothetical protein VGM81_18775 [Burkholderiaceae bacterium]
MNKKKRTEAVTPPALLERLVLSAGEEVVLVGGQALGFWLQYFGVALPPDEVAVSADTDFLTRSAADKPVVERFADVMGGRSLFPSDRALTALVGQAYFDISDDEFINVDVVFKVLGIKAETVRAHAVRVAHGTRSFLVMHPLHVLLSRQVNLYKLAEKQTPKGVMQMAMAIDMAREFLRAEAVSIKSGGQAARSPLQAMVSEIERMAKSDGGRKIARRYALHVADVIDPSLIPAGAFWTKRWPSLRKLMSPAYAQQFAAPA